MNQNFLASDHQKLSGKVAIISDLHLGHDRDFLYGKRGFASIREHDEFIISNLRSYLCPECTIVNLGDVCFNDSQGVKYARLLTVPHKIYFQIKGNHNSGLKHFLTQERRRSYYYCGSSTLFTYDKKMIFASHFPHLVWDKMSHGAINICGHSHGSFPETNPNSPKFGRFGKVIDCGVETALLHTNRERCFFWLDEILSLTSRVDNLKLDHHQ